MLKTCIDEHLAKVKKVFRGISNLPLVGTAGTITTLAAMAQRLKQYDQTRVHNYELTLKTLKALEKELLTKTGSERLRMPGLEPGREFAIVAGTVNFRRFMETFDFETCLVSDFGLREGILIDLAQNISKNNKDKLGEIF